MSNKTTKTLNITVERRNRELRGHNWRSYESRPRVYVDFADEKGELTYGEHPLDKAAFDDRRDGGRSKPALLLPYVAAALAVEDVRHAQTGRLLDKDDVRWDNHAGCSTCYCSPGFVVEDGLTHHYGDQAFDLWVTIR